MKRGEKIYYSSRVNKDSLEQLKELVYMNPNQPRDEAGILRALKEYGHPRIQKADDELRIHIGDHAPQSIFAYDEADAWNHPVGVVIFSRSDAETINIIHIAVHPEYAMHGKYAESGLGVHLIDQVREIAARVVGLRRIRLYYRRNLELKF